MICSSNNKDAHLFSWRWIVLRALLAALVLSGPALIVFARSAGNSAAVFCGWDEPYYLSALHRASDLPLSGLARLTDADILPYPDSQAGVPHYLLTLPLGHLQHILGLRTVTFSLLMDLICIFLAYLAFTWCFSRCRASQMTAELSAFVALFFPWLFHLSQYFTIPLGQLLPITTISHVSYPCLPILRSPYTQVGLVLLPLAVGFLINSFVHETSRRLPSALLGGILAGLSLYAYFFAWGAVLALAPVAALIAIGRCNSMSPVSRRSIVVSLAAFFLSCFVVSFPGILVIYKFYFGDTGAITDSPPGLQPPFGEDWYFSLEMGLFAVVCLVITLRSNVDSVWRPALLAASAILSEFLLMNAQPFLNLRLDPYHFPLFYLHPLLSGCMFCLLLPLFRSPRLKLAVVGITAGLGVFTSVLRTITVYQEHPKWGEFIELTSYLDSTAKADSKILSIPYGNPFSTLAAVPHGSLMPYWLEAITERDSVSRLVGIQPIEAVRRELLLGWYYTGLLQFIGPCPTAHDQAHGNLLRDMAYEIFESRKAACDLREAVLETTSVCDLLTAYPVDFLVFEPGFNTPLPLETRALLSASWKSSKGTYEVLHFDPEIVREAECQTPVLLDQ